MRSLAFISLFLAFAVGFAGHTQAASLRVAPVVLDLQSPTAASSIRVWNDANRPIHVQIRVFRWSQKGGEDSYEATSDVVASPPMTTLRPGGENLVRIVRTSKRPVQAEESYRLVVDELPEPSRRQAGTVALVVRHSIPVFFADPEAQGAEPTWSVQRQGNGYLVTAKNSGAKRLKVSNLALEAGASTLGRRDGLVGYVLGNSTTSWFVPGKKRASGRSLTIRADSEAGPFNAAARYKGG